MKIPWPYLCALVRQSGSIVAAGMVLLTLVGASSAAEIECKDYWNTDRQWREMSAICEAGARNGEPLSQVAVAIHLLNRGNLTDKARAEDLLRSAAAKGYDDAYYWLGGCQADANKAISYFEMANGSGGMGLMALVTAADTHFKGLGVPKDFQKARVVYRRAFEAMVDNANRGIPKPPGEWWSNAKWFIGQDAVVSVAERYGFAMKEVNGTTSVVEVEPHPELSDKELAERLWQRLSGRK